MEDYIKINNEVTLKSLQTNRTPEIIQGVKDRFNYVIDMVKDKLNSHMRVTDFGCKDGILLDILREKGFSNLVGVDCCEEVVDIVRGKGFVCVNSDLQNLPFNENYSDFIFLIHTLEHVPEPKLVIEECARILSPGGYIFIEVPIQSQIDLPEKWGHYHPFTKKSQIKELFSDFEIITEQSQETKSKSPWFRILFRKCEEK